MFTCLRTPFTQIRILTFGYERNTTPFFSEIKGRDDFIVRPIHSAAFMTAVALPTLFNAIPQPNGMVQIMHGTTNLFRLAKDQGFQTYWFTAQARNEMNILNLIGGKWIDKITFPEAFGLSDRESMPDFNLLTQFDTVNFNTGRQFVILHQRGVSGFLCLGRLFQGQPNEAALCI